MSPVTNSGCPATISKTENEGNSCDEKHKFAQKYVKRLMDIFNIQDSVKLKMIL
jgi:hypothetical protein